jgi:AraC family transcriptional regulator, positive regulator of tynA and feaB
VLMHVVKRGTRSFARRRDRGPTTVPAGHFSLRRSGPPTVELAPQATANVLILSVSSLRALVGDRLIVGAAASAEMRVLMVHVGLLEAMVDDLTPTGVAAAHEALVELIKGAVTRRLDGTAPLLAPALAERRKTSWRHASPIPTSPRRCWPASCMSLCARCTERPPRPRSR